MVDRFDHHRSSDFPFTVHAFVSGRHHDYSQMYIMEFFGTFVLNLAIAMNGSDDIKSAFHPLCVAATIVLVVTTGAPISGAHYNPSLTVGFWLAGDRKAPSNVIYIITALVAASCAQLLGSFLLDKDASLPVFDDDAGWMRACIAEVLGTYLAILNVLWVAMLTKTPLGNIGPIIVALGFYANILAFGGVSGAILNPGVAFGVWVTGMVHGCQKQAAKSILLFVLADLVGGALAGLTARLVLDNRKKHDEAVAKGLIVSSDSDA